ncbi:MAG: 50S ribosomal protein L22 [Candidatus Hydrogenedentota bacterium]
MAQALARAQHLRISARKLRLVADLVRGKKVSEARDILRFTVKGGAPLLSKVLASAVANVESVAAEKRQRVNSDDMVILRLEVNEGRTMNRFRPASRGRGVRIRKRSSHIEMVIGDPASRVASARPSTAARKEA